METQLYTIWMLGMTEPELHGPYQTDEERLNETKTMNSENPGESSVCRLNIVNGVPTVFPFLDVEMEDEE